jgi:hypothetical protein
MRGLMPQQALAETGWLALLGYGWQKAALESTFRQKCTV